MAAGLCGAIVFPPPPRLMPRSRVSLHRAGRPQQRLSGLSLHCLSEQLRVQRPSHVVYTAMRQQAPKVSQEFQGSQCCTLLGACPMPKQAPLTGHDAADSAGAAAAEYPDGHDGRLLGDADRAPDRCRRHVGAVAVAVGGVPVARAVRKVPPAPPTGQEASLISSQQGMLARTALCGN